MKRGVRYEREEVWITLETVADCYAVDVQLMREVYELGLIGPGQRTEAGVAIAAEALDRVAVVLRLHLQQGVNLPGIALILGIEED